MWVGRSGSGYRIGAYLHEGPGSSVWVVYELRLDGDAATITRTVSQGIT